MVPLNPLPLKKDLLNKNTKAVSVLMVTKNEKMSPLLKISVFPHPSLFGEPAIFLKINQLPPYPNVWKFHPPPSLIQQLKMGRNYENALEII